MSFNHFTIRILAPTALVLAAACTDRVPTDSAVPAGREVRTQIVCTVVVADRAMRCSEPGPAGGGAQDVILGGQGTYVRLESSSVSYDSVAGAFSADVSVQNLLAQQMGTPDGVMATGVKVFFEQLPVATQGTGAITIANADGTGNFTRINQPFFAYPEILEARGTSRPHTWRFDVPSSVLRFAFVVYVNTELAAEEGPLRWVQERGYVAVLPASVASIWGAGPSSLFAVADSSILHDDGTGWLPMAHPGGAVQLADVRGTSRYNVFAVGSGGTILQYDGNRWHLRARGPAGESRNLRAVWVDGSDVYAVGWGSSSQRTLVVRSHDGGATWTETMPALGVLNDVWSAGDHVYAVGLVRVSGQPEACILMHSADRGATWSTTSVPAPAACNLNAVSGTGPDDVIVAGGRFNASTNLWEALVMRSRDGGVSWVDTIIAGENGRSVASLATVPGGGMYAAGYRGTILRLDGDTWTDLTSSPPPMSGSLFLSFTDVWAGSASNVHIVGFEARFRFDGSTWTRESLGVPTLEMLRSVHGGPAGVFAAGARETNQAIPTALVLRNTGGGWVDSFVASDDSTRFTGVWSVGSNEVYTVGYQTLPGGSLVPLGWKYAGSGWTQMTLPAASAGVRLDAVTSTGPGIILALGHVPGAGGGAGPLTALRSTDGGTSWTQTSIPYTGTRAPTISKAWASGQEAWAVGYGGFVAPNHPPGGPPRPTSENEAFLLHYDGQQWAVAEVVPGRVYRGVWSAGSHVYVSGYVDAAGGYRGFLRYSSDGGASWTEYTAPGSTSGGLLTDVWAASPTDVHVVGFGGTVLRFDRARWLEGSPPGRPMLFGIWGSSDTNLYAVGNRGLILHGTR